MKGLILAGGRGSRLLPLTRRVPRCLIPIQDRPVIHRSILLMKGAGIVDIVVTTGHLAHRVKEILGDGEKLGVRLSYVHEDEPNGIGSVLRLAQPFLQGDTFVVCNGDVIADLDLADVLSYHQEQRADATLVLRPTSEEFKCHGPLDFDAEVPLSALIGEAADESGFLYPTGIRVLGPRIYDFLSPQSPCTLADALAHMVGSGCNIEGYVMDGYWSDLHNWERYGHVLWEISRGFVPEAPV